MEAANRLAASLAARANQNRPPNAFNRPPSSMLGRPPMNGPGPGRPPFSYPGPGRPPLSNPGPGRPPMSNPGPGRPPGNNNNTINNSPSNNKPKLNTNGKPPGMEIILDDEEEGDESPTCKMCMKDFWYKSELHDHLKAEHSIADPVQHEKEERMEKIKAEQEERQRKLAIIRAEQERKFRLAQREQEMRMKRAREEQQKKLRLIQAERARLEIEKKMRGEQLSPRGHMRPGLSITQLQLENQRPGSNFVRDSGDIEKLKRESFMERRIREQSILNTQSSSKDLINEIITNSKKRDKMKKDQAHGRLLVQQVLENRAKGQRMPVKMEKSPNSLLKANADLIGALAGSKGRGGVEANEEILLSKSKGIVISRVDGEASNYDKNRPSFQHKNGLFICDICQKTCRNSTEMMQHWKVHFMKESPGGKSKVKRERDDNNADGNNNPDQSTLRPMRLSNELAEIVGMKKASRQQCVKEVWAYIKRHKLLDSENGQYIIPDDKMGRVFGSERMRAFVLSKELSKHLKELDGNESSDNNKSSSKKGGARKQLAMSPKQKVKKEPVSENESTTTKVKKEKQSPSDKKKSPGRPSAKLKVKAEPKSDSEGGMKPPKSTQTPKAKKTNTPKIKKEPGSNKEETSDDQDDWTPLKERMNKNNKKKPGPTPKTKSIVRQKNGRKYKENIFNDNNSSDNNENDNQSEEQPSSNNTDSNKHTEVDDKSKIKKIQKLKKSNVFDPFASSSDDKPNDKENVAKKRKLDKNDKGPKIKIKKEPQSDHNDPPPPKPKSSSSATSRTTRGSKSKLPKIKKEPQSDHNDLSDPSVKDKIDNLFNNPPEPMDEDENEDNNDLEPDDPDKPVYNCENIESECKFKTYDQEKFRAHVDKVHLGGGDVEEKEASLSAADDLPLS